MDFRSSKLGNRHRTENDCGSSSSKTTVTTSTSSGNQSTSSQHHHQHFYYFAQEEHDQQQANEDNGKSLSSKKRKRRRTSDGSYLDNEIPAKRPATSVCKSEYSEPSSSASIYSSPPVDDLLAHEIIEISDSHSSSDCLSTEAEFDSITNYDDENEASSASTSPAPEISTSPSSASEELLLGESRSSTSPSRSTVSSYNDANISSKDVNINSSNNETSPNDNRHWHGRGDQTPHSSANANKSFDENDYISKCYDTPAADVKLCPLPALSWANASDVWKLMCHKDELGSHERDSTMLENHPGLQPRMRAILLDWLIEVCEVYKLHRETYYLAVDFLDRYLSKQRKVQKTHLQLIGITCLFVAAKVEEIYPPKIGEFAYVTDGACQEEDILKHELLLLQALDWKISPVTVMGWLGIYMQLNVSNRTPASLGSKSKTYSKTEEKVFQSNTKSQNNNNINFHNNDCSKDNLGGNSNNHSGENLLRFVRDRNLCKEKQNSFPNTSKISFNSDCSCSKNENNNSCNKEKQYSEEQFSKKLTEKENSYRIETRKCSHSPKGTSGPNDSGVSISSNNNTSENDDAFIYPQFSGMEFSQTAQLIDLCSLDVGMADFPYSVIAAAAISHTFDRETAVRVSGQDWNVIAPCARWMEPFFQVVKEESPYLMLSEVDEPVKSNYGLGNFCPNIVTDDSHIIQAHTISMEMFDKVSIHRVQCTSKVSFQEASPAVSASCPEGLLTPPYSNRKHCIEEHSEVVPSVMKRKKAS